MEPTNTVLDCFNNGTFNVDRYVRLRAKRNAVALEEIVNLSLMAAEEEQRIVEDGRRTHIRSRDLRGQMPKKVDEIGEIVPISPQETVWWSLYVENPPLHNKQFCKKFRRRFRMPYEQYRELCEEVIQDPLFKKWRTVDCTGKRSSPIELLLLGSLRYLGHGFTFDDCGENTAISEETHRRFFHVFIEFGSTVLFDKHVIAPANAESASTHQREFVEAGMPGCVGSTDATHIALLRCPSQLRNYHRNSFGCCRWHVDDPNFL